VRYGLPRRSVGTRVVSSSYPRRRVSSVRSTDRWIPAPEGIAFGHLRGKDGKNKDSIVGCNKQRALHRCERSMVSCPSVITPYVLLIDFGDVFQGASCCHYINPLEYSLFAQSVLFSVKIVYFTEKIMDTNHCNLLKKK